MTIKSFFINFGQYILVFLSYFFIFSFILGFSLGFLNAGGSVFIIAPLFALFSALYVFGLWKWYQHGKWSLEVKKTKLTAFVWLPAVLLAAFILIQSFFSFETSDNQTQVLAIIRSYPAFSFLLVVIFGPIVEEFLTRGFIAKFFFPKQMKLWQTLLYLVISSSIFSLLHMPATLVQFLIYFTMGAIFGLAYVTKKDLRYPIALHILNNLLAFIL